MLHLFLGLKSLVKVNRYHTDGSVFRLHYRVTVMALLAFTFIVTTRQYIGSPIMCVHTRDIPKDVLNTYCWIHPTYTLSSAHWKRVGVDVPHPGVDKTRDDRDKKHVKYYQWVGFCLFFQAILFYVPRWLWKNWGSWKDPCLNDGLGHWSRSRCGKTAKEKDYSSTTSPTTSNTINWWAYRYFFCEFLALVNIIGQMFLMDRFF
ncbi:inx [Lepeophtheirus salmonis]|uniref:Innexin n=1 Tax=Lepeophtheirus salmonis TaxID=72036 RepID=A0A7R8CDT5_LEPSM|nr:inx [Lepeophtheirus salmonis]CAF2783259.1 inx [Lepeophtheirus salmonis]